MPLQEAALTSKNNPSKQVEESPISICIAQKVVFKPRTLFSVQATTSASRSYTIKTRTLKKSMQMLSAAHSVIDEFLLQPINILLLNVFTKAIRIPKQMTLAYATDLPTAVVTKDPLRINRHQ